MIEHIFVLMLENRSFDHMLGWSGLIGADAATGQPTVVNGLSGTETNLLPGGARVAVERGAPFALDVDPTHEFADVLEQLCGPGSTLPGGGAYPPINMSGFASHFASEYPRQLATDGNVTMKAFTPEQLPVLHALAREFAVCDHWFSSLPGPTWPNRFFMHAASSGGLDDSPPGLRPVTAVVDGYRFANGTVFDRLEAAQRSWHIVEGDALPQAMAIHGMIGKALEGRFITMDNLRERLGAPGYDVAYTFIEPSYGHVLSDGRNFKMGNSQHPQDDVTRGEALIKQVYETIRNSAYWDTSLLIITYDEHGGFYDHVPPPPGVVPGDGWLDPSANSHGFHFDQLGVRVPAVVVSPLIPRGTIDHVVRDHGAVSATLREAFGTLPLTERDRTATGVIGLASLAAPRTDTPPVLPCPAPSGIPESDDSLIQRLAGALTEAPAALRGNPEAALIGFLEVAVIREVHMAARAAGGLEQGVAAVVSSLEQRVAGLTSKFDVAKYLHDVQRRYRPGGAA